jgi:hypothetical protein
MSQEQERKEKLLIEKEELIKVLSEIHKKHSTNPAILCSAHLHDFDFNNPRIAQYSTLTGQLFEICTQLDEQWTDI